jgi:hypothetical protein
MTSFEQRLKKGEDLSNKLIEYMNDNNIPYFLTGYESLLGFGGAKNKIISNNTKTSMFVRHYPDITAAFKNETVLIEVKNSTGIEHGAFMTYKKLKNNLGLNFMFFLRCEKFCKVDDIVFLKPDDICRISGLKIPIIDNYFRCPSLLNKTDYINYIESYKKINRSTSGNAFAFIDFVNSKMHDIDILKKLNDKYNKFRIIK